MLHMRMMTMISRQYSIHVPVHAERSSTGRLFTKHYHTASRSKGILTCPRLRTQLPFPAVVYSSWWLIALFAGSLLLADQMMNPPRPTTVHQHESKRLQWIRVNAVWWNEEGCSSANHYLLFIIYYSLFFYFFILFYFYFFIIFYLLFIIYYLLFIIYSYILLNLAHGPLALCTCSLLTDTTFSHSGYSTA